MFARAEMSEEALLAGGTIVPLMEGGATLVEVKWGMNRFAPFLILDPHPDPHPGARCAAALIYDSLCLSCKRVNLLVVRLRRYVADRRNVLPIQPGRKPGAEQSALSFA